MESVLLLNSSYEVLSVVSLQRAVRLLFAKKAEVVHESARVLRSERMEFPLPSVLRMLYYVARKRKHVALTKKNVLLRDNYKCAYCDKNGDDSSMNVDHIQPRSQGGKSTWLNLVASCMTCNSRKMNRTPAAAGMPLRRNPTVPKHIPFMVVKRHTQRDEWHKYLSLYNIGIEERVG
jgi:5-methylcytosine-specific restriction endonuclease McrA